MRTVLLGLALALGCLAAAHADTGGGTALTAEQREAETQKLGWIQEPGDYELALSHSRIQLPKGYSLLLGADAARYDQLWNGYESPNTEAIVFSDNDNTFAYFIYEDAGHVTEDDWKDVDAADFLKQLKDADADANTQRRNAGLDEFNTGDWREKPHFDGGTKTAYWAFELFNDKNRWINATAIRLARTGYHRIIWVGNTDRFQSASGSLDTLIAMHDYDAGYRYGDFAEGDKLAGYGIGALAAAVLGVKLGKGVFAAIIAGILIFGKKLGILVVAVGAGVAVWVRRLRRSRRGPPPA